VEWRSEPAGRPGAGQVRIVTALSGISAGTETLLYRGEAPEDLAADASIAALGGSLRYPLPYGYSLVGTVTGLGRSVDAAWEGRRVFAFHPHASETVLPLEALIPLPAHLAFEDALFLPNMETAFTLIMDGAPLMGEEVHVFGQGVVGLLTTALLAAYPLGGLRTVEPNGRRRAWSRSLGAHECVADDTEGEPALNGADLVYELSGNPLALNRAIAVAGYSGRIVVGSWYGTRSVPLDLGRAFHRGRLRLLSSQVSTIDPARRGRWDRDRRLRQVLGLLAQHRPSRLISHVLPAFRAAEAYEMLDGPPDDLLQVVLAYH
jgi:alcohol dehydrogenase